MPKHLISGSTLIAAVILLLMLNFTTPAGIGPFGVLVFFTTFYILMFGIATGIVRIFVKLLDRKMGNKEYLYGVVLAFGPIMLLLLQSMGGLTIWTVGMMVIFVLLGCFLVSKIF